jgi:hypothetical protein
MSSKPKVATPDYIRGEAKFGSWSDYHREWVVAFNGIDGRALRLDFQSVLADRENACEQIRSLIDLPFVPDVSVKAFEKQHEHNPAMYGYGSNAGWEQYYSRDQMRLLWELHQGVMETLGYPEPDYSLGLEEAKI